MNPTPPCSGISPSADELASVAELVRATKAGELETLTALFAADAQVNDQLRNFWGHAEIRSWLEREIVGEKVELNVLGITKHYDVVIVNAEIRGDFEMPRIPQPMVFDLYFTVHESRIVRLLILLARTDTPEPEIRRSV